VQLIGEFGDVGFPSGLLGPHPILSCRLAASAAIK
jgi:hypothetical protein